MSRQRLSCRKTDNASQFMSGSTTVRYVHAYRQDKRRNRPETCKALHTSGCLKLSGLSYRRALSTQTSSLQQNQDRGGRENAPKADRYPVPLQWLQACIIVQVMEIPGDITRTNRPSISQRPLSPNLYGRCSRIYTTPHVTDASTLRPKRDPGPLLPTPCTILGVATVSLWRSNPISIVVHASITHARNVDKPTPSKQ